MLLKINPKPFINFWGVKTTTTENPRVVIPQTRTLTKKGQLVARWVKDENDHLVCQWVQES